MCGSYAKVVDPVVAPLLDALGTLPDASDDVDDDDEDEASATPPVAPPRSPTGSASLFAPSEGEVAAMLEAVRGPVPHEADEGDELVVPVCAEDRLGQSWVVALHQGARTPDDDLDIAAVQVADFLLKEKVHMNSTTAEAAALSVDRKWLRESQVTVADAGWHLERGAWRGLERSLVAAGPDVEVLNYVDYAAYDGVDLKLMTKNFWSRVAERAPVVGALEDVSAVEKLVLELREKKPVEEQLGMAKILHSKQYVGMVLRIGGEIVYLVGHLGSLLVGLDRSTGEGILGAVMRLDPGSEARENIPRKLRLNESDNAGYNDRCERGLLDTREGWMGLRFGCEVHYASGTHSKTFGVVPLDVSGFINTTLSLRDFGMLIQFRASARTVLRRILKLYHKDELVLDDGALAFRKLVLDVLVGSDPKDRLFKETLVRLSPGDWRVVTEFQWILIADESFEQVLDLLVEGLIPLFWGVAPFEFPRNRWTGAERTFRAIGAPVC